MTPRRAPKPSDLPRWRRKRAADLQHIAGGYGAALLVCAAVAAAACFLRGGLAHRALDFTAWVIIAFCAVVYLAAGGLVVADAVPRVVTWLGRSVSPSPMGNWIRVLFWPLSVGGLLLRLAGVPQRGG